MNHTQNHVHIDPEREDVLRKLAKKYIWWKSIDEAMQHPDLVVSKVMDIGDYLDVQKLVGSFSDKDLKEVLLTAEPGVFRPRSWAYWNYRLGIATLDHLPQLPLRRFNS